MSTASPYIVQFVGFKTDLNDSGFIQRWLPFAKNFKNAGIESINLYKVNKSKVLTFISRNIWDAETYLENFPSGMAVSGSGGGISVTQFGGYWIDENDLNFPNHLQLLFSNEDFPASILCRKRCREEVSFQNQMELGEKDTDLLSKYAASVLDCTHLKTL